MSDPFKPVDRDTPYLLPPSLQDWLPQEHLARFVVEIVDRLDLSELERAYGGRGKTPYHPAVMAALLFYGYATGVFSSRKLEQATYDSVAFRYITADTHPDHDTIARFRKRFPVTIGCVQYFVGLSRPPQGVVDLRHAVVLGNEERTHPLYPFIAPAPRFNVIDGPRAMRPVPIPPGFGEHSGPHKRVEPATREPRTLTHVVLKQHGCPGRVHTAPRIRTTFGASVPVTNRPHRAITGRRRSSRSVRT